MYNFAVQIRNDSSQILFMLLPELCAKCQALPTIFNRIDQLEVNILLNDLFLFYKQ